jgi:hypothetical protein
MNDTRERLRDALRVVFELTGAASIEIHSGDREPGSWIERHTIITTQSRGEGDNEPTDDHGSTTR